MHETTTKRPGRAGKYIRRALLALAAVILAAVLVPCSKPSCAP